jgi:hypothetical protein
MTFVELQSLAFEASSLAATYLGILITVISGYLIVAYVVGAHLAKGQIIIINFLYIFFATLLWYANSAALFKQVEIVEQLRAIQPDAFYPAGYEVAFAVALVTYLVVLASLKFMWDIRHPKEE